MKKLICLFFTVLLSSSFMISAATSFNSLENNSDLPPCYAWISTEQENLMTGEIQTIWTFTYLGEVNYGNPTDNQIACNMRATVAQILANGN